MCSQRHASHTHRWKDKSLGHKATWHKATWVYAPLPTYREDCKLGYTHLQTIVHTHHHQTHVSVPSSSSGSKFKSPRLAFKMCCSPFHFMLPQSNSVFQSSKAILYLRTIRGGTLPLLLHSMPCWLSPSTPPLLQEAFPDELTGSNSEFALVTCTC